MQTDLMKHLIDDLTKEEVENLSEWIKITLEPLNELSSAIKDMSSTIESSELLSETVHQVLSPEGFEEVSKWLEKS